MRNDSLPPSALDVSRRSFLASSAAAGLAAMAPRARAAETAANVTTPNRPQVCLFSKCLQPRNVPRLAEAIVELGFKGVDLTVRPGGHVLPERVTEDLPKAHEVLDKAGVRITMITTDITSARQRHATEVLRTAAALNIPYTKLGYYDYKDPKAILKSAAAAKVELRGLVPLLEEHRMVAGFHNHSGMHVGALMWDEWDLIHDLDARRIGSYFDPGHATVEGGLGGWRIGLNLLAPRINMLAVKDFTWRKEKDGWRPEFGPLAQGTVRWGEVFSTLKSRGFAGPISLHVEYTPRAPVDSEEEKTVFAAVRRDAEFLRTALARAGIDAT
jgi:L-ribulose-5-phosphate 3-epimerase